MSKHLLPNRQPDASRHRPDPAYLRSLVERSGLSQVECARRIDVNPSTLRKYLATGTRTAASAPYLVQYALERLAEND